MASLVAMPSTTHVRVPRGPLRAGQAHPYATVAPRVREAIEVHGVVEATALAMKLGATLSSVAVALKAEVRASRVVAVFRGVFATPAMAVTIRAAAPAALTNHDMPKAKAPTRARRS